MITIFLYQLNLPNIQILIIYTLLFLQHDINIVLGNWFGTKQLSLGEWQRVAIARAFIKNADLYIFDEPDASLDVMAEIEMLSYYKKILKNKMGFLKQHFP